MKFLILIFLILIGTIKISTAQNIEFFREDITFEITDNSFIVDGIYYFCNVGEKPVNQILYYPFSAGSDYGEVDTISVINLKTKSNVLRKFNNNGASFVISIEPYNIDKYKIFYRQKIFKNKAEYILNTTKSWKKPFEKANYELIMGIDYIIDSASYIPDSVEIIGDFQHFYWNKQDFMPDRNFIIYFNKKE
jgi:hypothetical protein